MTFTCLSSVRFQLNQEIDQLERLMAAPFDIDMANELKYLLPESQESATDTLSVRRRRHRELVRCVPGC